MQFGGDHANSQAVLMNSNPLGQMTARRQLESLTAPNGIYNSGKAANCQAVCLRNPADELVSRRRPCGHHSRGKKTHLIVEKSGADSTAERGWCTHRELNSGEIGQ
jgi:hypothetical protein